RHGRIDEVEGFVLEAQVLRVVEVEGRHAEALELSVRDDAEFGGDPAQVLGSLDGWRALQVDPEELDVGHAACPGQLEERPALAEPDLEDAERPAERQKSLQGLLDDARKAQDLVVDLLEAARARLDDAHPVTPSLRAVVRGHEPAHDPTSDSSG